MGLLLVAADRRPAVESVLASAHVVEVSEGNGFCASVWIGVGTTPVAFLDKSIRGAPHEGAVLRWTMMRTTGLYGTGLFVYDQAGAAVRDTECSVLWPCMRLLQAYDAC